MLGQFLRSALRTYKSLTPELLSEEAFYPALMKDSKACRTLRLVTDGIQTDFYDQELRVAEAVDTVAKHFDATLR